MTGALLQLVARGHIDARLTGNPEISYFKIVYRRHTNFSMEALEQSFTGEVVNAGGTTTADIVTNGDLIHNMWLDVKFPGGLIESTNADFEASYTYNTGHALIDEVSLKIGGQTIDKHSGGFMNAHTELTDHEDAEKNILNRKRKVGIGTSPSLVCKALQLYVPLKFWFNRHPGLALPLVAIYNQPITIDLKTRDVRGLINSNATGAHDAIATDATLSINVKLYANTIYLDKEERRRFAETPQHEYLIEQVQYQKLNFEKTVRLNFNYPVKELIWTIQYSSTSQAVSGLADLALDGLNNTPDADDRTITMKNNYFNFVCLDSTVTDNVNSGIDRHHAFETATLKINSKPRFEAQKASYFKYLQRAQAGHRTLGNRDLLRGTAITAVQAFDHTNIYCYSFALHPEKHQPSGTCNFSKLENAQLEFTNPATTQAKDIIVYAINYNILIITDGYAKLAYN